MVSSLPNSRATTNSGDLANTRQAGAHWEKTAESFLTGQGLKLLQRNFSSRLGEIDLIMEDDKTIVFVEVRYRKSSHFGDGAESITLHKQNRISRTAAWYLVKNPHRAEQFCRFDIISIGAILKDPHKKEQGIDWIQNAFYSTLE
jgi:putative endonuclease